VDVMEVDGPRWPVAPYGAVNWVKNVRAAVHVELSRGGTSSGWKAEEVRGVGRRVTSTDVERASRIVEVGSRPPNASAADEASEVSRERNVN
ncbi:MAG: hypothetical protein QOE89_380, partial [Pseudonocardiales bacterium]|nr:hypothetical protein [Pseudonocardiales bacterium]